MAGAFAPYPRKPTQNVSKTTTLLTMHWAGREAVCAQLSWKPISEVLVGVESHLWSIVAVKSSQADGRKASAEMCVLLCGSTIIPPRILCVLLKLLYHCLLTDCVSLRVNQRKNTIWQWRVYSLKQFRFVRHLSLVQISSFSLSNQKGQ